MSWARFHHYRRRIDTILSSVQLYEYHTGSHRSHISSVVPSSSECRAGPRAVTTSSALSPSELRSWLPSASFPSASGPVKTIPYTLPRSVVLCRNTGVENCVHAMSSPERETLDASCRSRMKREVRIAVKQLRLYGVGGNLTWVREAFRKRGVDRGTGRTLLPMLTWVLRV